MIESTGTGPRLTALACAVVATSALSFGQTFVQGNDPTHQTFPATGQPLFADVTAASGVNFAHDDTIDTMAGGVCFLDFDNDGDPDLYATNRNGKSNILFKNVGNGQFVDASAGSGTRSQAGTMGAYAADLNNDGLQDLLLIMVSKVRLMINDGDGTFSDVPNGGGIINPDWTTAATFADYNNDGLLDIYLGNYIEEGFFPYYDGAPNRLFRNDGNMKFTDVSVAAGVDGLTTFWDPRGWTRTTYPCTLSTLFYDFDRDGWMDLLVGNDFGPFLIPDQLFRNNQDGTFTEIGAAAGFDIAEFNMGLAAGDVNGDLIPDIYTTNMGMNHLLLNDGNGRFNDVTQQWGVMEDTGPTGIALTSWGCLFFDLDLDGLKDLYVSNGHVAVTNPPIPNEPLAPSKPYQNMGRKFEILNKSEFPWDFGTGRGAACADIDGDGDEDLIQLNNRQTLRVYRNDTVTNNKRVTLDLTGTLSNRDAIGAYIVARSRQFTQAHDNLRGGSYISCNGSSVILGLSTDPRVEELTVRWPSGVTSNLLALEGDQRHAVVEPTVSLDSIATARAAGTAFTEIPVTLTNHSSSSETVTFMGGLSLGSTRIEGPAYHLPITLAAGETATHSVYLHIPFSAAPAARQMGVWMQLTAISGTAGGKDQAEQTF